MSTLTMPRMVTRPKIEETVPVHKRKRIPVSKVYWEKGMYKELVDDPYNLKE